MPSADEHLLLTTNEACERLYVSRSTLTRWVKAGRLRPVRKLPGRTGSFLFRLADVKALAGAAS